MPLATYGGPTIRKIDPSMYAQHRRTNRHNWFERILHDFSPDDTVQLTAAQRARVLPRVMQRFIKAHPEQGR